MQVINWDEYFMGIALLSAKRSKDPSTQVGACIVDDDHKVVSIGYNGMPRGIADNESNIHKPRTKVFHRQYSFISGRRTDTVLV